jgi:replicative DNA helicase
MNENNLKLLLNKNSDIDFDFANSLENTLKRHKEEKLQGKIAGLMTGFKIFDTYTGGLRPCTMNIIAARPSVGKTALGYQIAYNIALKHNVLFFSAEMDIEELNDRYLSQKAQVNSYSIMNNKFSDMEYINMYNIIQETKKEIGNRLVVDTTHQIKWQELKRKAIKQYNKGLDLIIIDHMSLIGSEDNIRDTQYNLTTKISHSIKGLSKQLKIPILVLNQLNRDGLNEDKEPELHNIRESGHIEQDADVIIALYRDSKLKNTDDYNRKIKCKILKNRSGQYGIQRELIFAREFAMFQDAESHGEQLAY